MLIDIVLRKTRRPAQPSARLAGWLLAASFCGASMGKTPAGAQAHARRHAAASAREDGRGQSNLDYAFFQLENNPGDTLGSAVIEEFRPAEGHLITIIQNPQGQRKQVEVGRSSAMSAWPDLSAA